MQTYTELMRGFEFGPWTVLPERGLIQDGDEERKIEPIVMDVFVVLASHDGDVVSPDMLIDEVWDGRPQMDDVITRCITVLRKALGDDAKSPKFIETLRKRGYRVMLPVQPLAGLTPIIDTPRHSYKTEFIAIAVLVLLAIALVTFISSEPDLPLPADGAMNSVAVFPFECQQDGVGNSEHLCFGFAEDAISSLKRIEGLKVVRIRQPYTDNSDVGERQLVTGSVQILQGQVRVTAQLEDANSGEITWSNSYEGDATSTFDLQRQVAAGLLAAIDTEFQESPSDMYVPASFAAAEAYSRGRFLFEKRDHQSTVDAVAQFEEAIRLDPELGAAWLGLAYTYVIWPDYDLSVDREAMYESALNAVGKGVDIDSRIRNAAGTVYGFVHHKRNQWIEAADSFETAIQDPNVEPIAHHWYSRVLASVGRLDDALVHARRAVELDPGHPDQAIMFSRLAIANFWLDNLEEAGRYFAIANSMNLEASIHSLAYSLYLVRLGDIDGAKTFAKMGLDQNNVDSTWVDPVFDGLKEGGDRQRSLGILGQLSGMGALPENVEMTLWQLFGEVGPAMTVARRLEDAGGLFELEIIFIDEFESFRQHPDFAEFIDAIGLTDYWSKAGCFWANDRVDCR
jgi:DNA-binding winged helix-turn-helix (wHTH) protein/TolB-like protein/Tfp pilus assembly protein PilF